MGLCRRKVPQGLANETDRGNALLISAFGMLDVQVWNHCLNLFCVFPSYRHGTGGSPIGSQFIFRGVRLAGGIEALVYRQGSLSEYSVVRLCSYD